MLQSEANMINRHNRYDKIKIMSRINDYEKELLLDKLDEKSKVIDEFKSKRLSIAEQKRGINNNLAVKKNEYKQTFEKIAKYQEFDVSEVSL